nr:LLM class flavin-dependent oxidoreductase [Protofrankia symbiont of Coriaria ruscifolia]
MVPASTACGLSSPWTFLAHATARTSRIRLGTAITVLPLESPIMLAEDVSVVDALSGGRVELGVGSGYGADEYAAFGVDLQRRRELTTEALDVVTRALANEPVGTDSFTIQPPAGDFSDRIWQGVFSREGAVFVARGGSRLLLNRATYGYDEPTDEVQRRWADAFLKECSKTREPRIGLSRMLFPAKDRRAALAQREEGTLHAAELLVERGQFPAGLDLEGYLRRLHSFHGHPDEITAQLQAERVLPVATDLICQFNPGVPDQDAAIRALELIATEIAPALGWRPAAEPTDQATTTPTPAHRAEPEGPPFFENLQS